jgi:hypothetical protein
LAILIGAGAMLGASAIIAIPLISDSAPLSDKEIAEAQTGVDALLPDTEITKHIETTAVEVPKGVFAEIVAAHIKEASLPSDPLHSAPTNNPDSSKGKPTEIVSGRGGNALTGTEVKRRQRDSRLESYARTAQLESEAFWDSAREGFLRQIEDTKTTAHQLMAKQNLFLTNARSKAGYLVDIKGWVERSRVSIFARASSCRFAIDQAKGHFGDSVDRVLRKFSSDSTTDPDITGYNYEFYSANLRQFCAFGGGLAIPETTSLPALGAFSFATWLIKLNSIALTLVAGMFGFGLLGAAISSVVRESKTRQPDEPLVKDLTSIAIRGMSATIVVYLAAKGGLAIFTGGAAPEPNPYVLLLTCFVASVFGDDVWLSARKWFSGGPSSSATNPPADSK